MFRQRTFQYFLFTVPVSLLTLSSSSSSSCPSDLHHVREDAPGEMEAMALEVAGTKARNCYSYLVGRATSHLWYCLLFEVFQSKYYQNYVVLLLLLLEVYTTEEVAVPSLLQRGS